MAELDRRDFLKLAGVSAGGAAAAGCSDHVEKLIPYVVQPEEIIPGKAVVYASTCLECPAACGLHVRTREGRPIKLEGNPEHPVNRGALCALGQASIGRTYHPDRYREAAPAGTRAEPAQEISWEQATALLAEKLGAAGGRVRALTGELGPTLARALRSLPRRGRERRTDGSTTSPSATKRCARRRARSSAAACARSSTSRAPIS